jgi:NADPH:quinone reductase-like Zn-dependent oxidoreductase
MRAIVCTRYGPPDVLQLREVPKPVPKENEVLIRVHAATVLAGDCALRGLKLPLLWQPLMRIGFGFRGPRRKIIGQELAGEIESVGNAVTLFKKGDQVFANTGLHLGAYAEYNCLPQKALMTLKPANVTYEEAAAIPIGIHALHFLRKANIQNGEKVLINGAGGSIGTFAVQLAKSYGAEVTGVDSAGKLEMLRSIGVDKVIDYTQEDFTKNGETYDVIFDAVGKSSYSGSLRSLKRNGRYLLGNPGLSHMIRGRWTSKRDNKKVMSTMKYRTEDLATLAELIGSGKIKSVIDRRYPLEQTAEAHRYVDTGQQKGTVVIRIN